MDAATPAPAAPESLDARYGRRPPSRRRRILIGAGAGAALLGAAAWMLWAGLGLATGPSVEGELATFRAIDAGRAEVVFRVTTAPGTDAVCAVQALDENSAVVGWKVVPVPDSTDFTQVLTVPLTTIREARAGLIERCWLP